MSMRQSSALRSHPVWDATTRWFHWINVLCVLGLLGVGLVILNAGALGISGEGKVALKTLHVWIGYLFAINLLWRIVWGFVGNRYARWSAALPGGRGYGQALVGYLRGLRAGNPPSYRGHNPLGRLMVALLLVLLVNQCVTGLVLAGTDLYLPPFGHLFLDWVAVPGASAEQLAGLKPAQTPLLDADAYAAMRAFRKPFYELHELGFWGLVLAIPLHIAAVVITELRERNGLISAMFSGRKVFSGEPRD
jgi:cytochrome b|tara:strand:+ start:1128 stop:1874 length:747 start_codon:yes stop_codon:yes gene_type:complete